MNAKVILNPYANRWHAGEKRAAVEAAFAAAGVPADLTVTAAPGEAIEVARAAAAAGYDAVVAAGGDGTVSEVVNGLVQATTPGQPTIPLGIIPIGTANDFSDMVKVPRELLTAAKIVLAGQTRQIDLGKITLPEANDEDDYYFNNNSAVAMEPMVTLEHIKMTRLSGEIRYMVALVRALVRLKAWHMKIRWDDGQFEGPAYLLSVCNSPRTGGFYMAPDAKTEDGLLDFVFVPEVPKRTVLAILGRLLRGTHIHHPQVTYHRTTCLSIQSRPGTPLHADGEILSESVAAVDYQVLPGKLSLLTR